MADPSLFDPIRIPVSALVALDWRPYHFALQPFHYLVRTAHVAAMGAFFGGIGLLDFRLMGWRATVPLRAFAEHVLPWLWATFGIAVATGVALFLYDPVHVGAHAYWAPKLLAVALGLANAAMFHRTSYVAALAAEARCRSRPARRGRSPWLAGRAPSCSPAWTPRGRPRCCCANIEALRMTTTSRSLKFAVAGQQLRGSQPWMARLNRLSKQFQALLYRENGTERGRMLADAYADTA